MADSKVLSTLASLARWTARVYSILLALLVLLMTIEADPVGLPPRALLDYYLTYASIAVSVLALLAAWKSEAIGGAVAIAVGLAMQFLFVLETRTWHPDYLIVTLILGVPGALYLASWALRRARPAAT